MVDDKYKLIVIFALLSSLVTSLVIYMFLPEEDTQPPSSFELLTPQDNAKISDNSPELIWRASRDSGTGVKHYEVWVDGKNTDNVKAPSLGINKLFYLFSPNKHRVKDLPDQWQTVVYTISGLEEGSHEWKIVSVDGAGYRTQSVGKFRFELIGEHFSAYEEENIKLGEGHFLWAIGGKIEGQGCLNDTLVYSIDEDKWFKMSDMPYAVQGAGGTTYENKIYAFGGKTDPHKGASSYVQVYDIENDGWTVIDSMPEPRSKLGKFYPVVNGKVYLFGGDNEAGRYNRVNWNWEYDLETGTWDTMVSDAPYSQSFPIVTLDNGWLYFTSGNTGSAGPINDYPGAINQRYNPSTDEWEIKTPGPDPVTDGAGDKWNGKLHIIGGWDTNPGFDWVFDWNYDKHWVYDYDKDSWSYNPDLPNEWHHQGVRAGENYLWNYLGRIDISHVNKIFRWNGANWKEKTSAPIGGKMNFGTIYTTIGPVSSE